MFLNYVVCIKIPESSPCNFVNALDVLAFLLFYSSRLLRLAGRWCSTNCNAFLHYCCLNWVFIAQYTMKTRCQSLEFPELIVKIAFCFFLKLMVTDSEGAQM